MGQVQWDTGFATGSVVDGVVPELKSHLTLCSDSTFGVIEPKADMLMRVSACRAAQDPDVASQVQWDTDFAIGSLVDVSVHELKDYGVVLDFAAHADVLGLAAKHQVSACSHFNPVLCIRLSGMHC